jgi:DNA-binding response OmpR family regulator
MRVLLIDSNETVDAMVVNTLMQNGYEVVSATPGSYAEHAVATSVYDLIIVDLDRSQANRASTIARLRSRAPSVAILMLSSGSDSNERIVGLDAGADDCLSRPFDPIELRARIRALSRRGRRDTLQLGRFVWDWEHRQGEVDSTPIALSRYETVLLEALLKSPNRVVPMRVLAQRIETADGPEANNRLYVYISRLRKKLLATDLRIRSSSGLGYSIEWRQDGVSSIGRASASHDAC